MIALVTDLPRGVLRPRPERPNLRRRERHPVDARAWLRSDDFTARAMVLDLHSDGAQVASDVDIPAGTPLMLRCYLRGARKPLCAWAHAVRSERRQDGRFGVGLSFQGLPRAQRGALERFLGGKQKLAKWSEQFVF